MYESEATSVKLKCFTVLEIGAGGLIITQQPLSLQNVLLVITAGELSNVVSTCPPNFVNFPERNVRCKYNSFLTI